MNTNSIPTSFRLALSLLTACATLVALAGLPPDQQPKFEPQQPPAPAVPNELEKMHAEHLQFFGQSPGFGSDRIDHLPPRATVTLAGTTYSVVRPDLIALETKAVAYRNPGEGVVSMAMLTNKTVKARLQTRPISGEEFRAILELREGKDLVQRPGKVQIPQGAGQPPTEVPVIRVVGAMRATASCARCHEVPQGTLLGAFSYHLVPASSGAADLLGAGSFPRRGTR